MTPAFPLLTEGEHFQTHSAEGKCFFLSLFLIYTMCNTTFTIRPARPADAPALARGIVMALHEDIALSFAGSPDRLPLVDELFRRLAERDDTQYSHRNALVAEDPEGNVAAILIAYDGALLHRLRQPFVNEANALLGTDFDNETMDAETSADEFYLDSLAVFPPYRGHRLGSRLILAMAEHHASAGKPLGLLCEQGYEHLRRLYTSLGFRDVGIRPFAGTEMHHMQRECQTSSARMNFN